MSSAYLIAACRTPIGKFLGGLASRSAPQLASIALQGCLERGGVSAEEVDQVILGQVLPAGVGQAPARQAALMAGMPERVPAFSINHVCGSGLQAVVLAAQAILAGDCRAVLAGGMESMSQAPHVLPGGRLGSKFGHWQLLDSMLHDGLTCAIERKAMGDIADATAIACDVSRADQDAFALESQRRATRAAEEGWFRREIVPVVISQARKEVIVADDENIRRDTSRESLEKLRPVFSAEGTVTAGNASTLADGAAAVLVVEETLADKGATRARIVATINVARAPRELFVAPIDAIQAVLQKAKLRESDIDLFEINEAFAAQCLACNRELKIPLEKLNVHGGAIALGHPIGASGARILVTLLHALEQRQLRYGLASLCLGGGGSVAMIVERV